MLIKDRHIDPTDAVAIHRLSTPLAPAINLTNAIVRLIKASDHAIRLLGVRVYTRLLAGAVSLDMAICGSDGLIVGTTLAISATAEKFKTITTTAVYLSSGVAKTKAATDNLVFSAANTVNTAAAAGQFFGAWLVQVDAAGAVSTKPAAGLADQVFATLAAAIAALPAADATKVALGYITVKSKAATKWTANTDDLTNASDVDTATFVSYTPRKPLTGAIAPLAGQNVEGVLDANQANIQAELAEYIALICTTDGTGALTDGFLSFSYRAGRVYRGEN